MKTPTFVVFFDLDIFSLQFGMLVCVMVNYQALNMCTLKVEIRELHTVTLEMTWLGD